MRFSLPSINVRRLFPATSDYCRLFRCLNCAQRFDYRAVGSSRKLGGIDRGHAHHQGIYSNITKQVNKRINKNILRGSNVSLSWISCASPVLVELEFGDVGFCGGSKIGEPGQKLSEQGENQQQSQPMYGTGLESNPDTLVEGERFDHCAISELRLHHPCFPIINKSKRTERRIHSSCRLNWRWVRWEGGLGGIRTTVERSNGSVSTCDTHCWKDCCIFRACGKIKRIYEESVSRR